MQVGSFEFIAGNAKRCSGFLNINASMGKPCRAGVPQYVRGDVFTQSGLSADRTKSLVRLNQLLPEIVNDVLGRKLV